MVSRDFVNGRILDSMKSIFAFARSRTPNADRAEDLSQQILAELLASYDTLRDEEAFYGWMWAVARNTYGKYIRANKRDSSYTEAADIADIEPGDADADTERDVLLREDMALLRREMSLLSRQYREAVVKYYIEEKSCLQISDELSVPVETVKHLLFKARNILREGMTMTRQYGEKSYNPDIFRFDKWVTQDAWSKYNDLTNIFTSRRLPGNILLATYYSPMSVEELSVELGVSAPYIEDELNMLLAAGVIKQLPRARYQANIFIYTAECDEEIRAKSKNLHREVSRRLTGYVDKLIPAFRENAFSGAGAPLNTIRWFAAHFIVWYAMAKKSRDIDPMPLLPLGGRGLLWGYNFEYRKDGFIGIWGHVTSDNYDGWLHSANYRLLESCQPRIGGTNWGTDFLFAAANGSYGRYSRDELAQYIAQGFIEKDGDSYRPLCPNMTQAQHGRLCAACEAATDEMAEMMAQFVPVTAGIMENHAPAAVKELCAPLAVFKADGIAEVMEYLCEDGYLMVPSGRGFYTVFTVV